MNLSVSDDLVIVNIQGIRNVTWGRNHYSSPYNADSPWFITVTYKGSHNQFHYKTEEAARAMFEKIRVAMDKEYKNAFDKATNRQGGYLNIRDDR